MAFDQAKADAILERIADGESLRAICRDEDMPDKATVFRWLSQHAEFRDQYALAREAQADSLFDDVLHIADTPQLGQKRKLVGHVEIGPEGEEGEPLNLREVEVTEGDMLEHRKLQIDARKWMAGKLRPKKYGDKLALGGDEDAPPIKIDLTMTETARRVAFLLASAMQETPR